MDPNPAGSSSPAHSVSFDTLVRLVERLVDGSQAAAAKYEASADAFNTSLTGALGAVDKTLSLLKERDDTIRDLERQLAAARDERRDNKNNTDRRFEAMERDLATLKNDDAELKSSLTAVNTTLTTLSTDFTPIKKAHLDGEAWKKKVFTAVVIAAVLGILSMIGGFVWVGFKLSVMANGGGG